MTNYKKICTSKKNNKVLKKKKISLYIYKTIVRGLKCFRVLMSDKPESRKKVEFASTHRLFQKGTIIRETPFLEFSFRLGQHQIRITVL